MNPKAVGCAPLGAPITWAHCDDYLIARGDVARQAENGHLELAITLPGTFSTVTSERQRSSPFLPRVLDQWSVHHDAWIGVYRGRP